MNTTDKLSELKKLSYPIRFERSEWEFIFEIQYLVEHKTENGLLHFAVTPDGWDLLVDAKNESDLIIQREYDDLDSLGVTLSELLGANKVTL